MKFSMVVLCSCHGCGPDRSALVFPCSFRVAATFSLRATTRNWTSHMVMSRFPQMSQMSMVHLDLCCGYAFCTFQSKQLTSREVKKEFLRNSGLRPGNAIWTFWKFSTFGTWLLKIHSTSTVKWENKTFWTLGPQSQRRPYPRLTCWGRMELPSMHCGLRSHWIRPAS